MAKDKTKKTAAASDDFAKPSEAPAGGDSWKLADDDHLGDLFLITPLRIEDKSDSFNKDGGTKEVIICDVVHLNEKKPEKSEEHTDVWVFQGYLKGALRGFVGQRKVLGRLVRGDKKDRGNFPWMLEDASADDVETARAYMASIDPFVQKGASKSADDDEDEKPAKKKKSKK